MISLDHVKLLEEKVEQALAKIIELKEENAFLKAKNDSLTDENSKLRSTLSNFEADQTQIEKGILNALTRLNTVESTIYKTVSAQDSIPQTDRSNIVTQEIKEISPKTEEVISNQTETVSEENVEDNTEVTLISSEVEQATLSDDDFSLDFQLDIPPANDMFAFDDTEEQNIF